jgi:hypothetical protein
LASLLDGRWTTRASLSNWARHCSIRFRVFTSSLRNGMPLEKVSNVRVNFRHGAAGGELGREGKAGNLLVGC